MTDKDLTVGDEVLLYGDVGDPWGWGDGFTAEQVATALAARGHGPISMRLNSGGGIAFEGLAIYSLLKAHDGDVTIFVDGIAASAASLIAMGGRLMMRAGSMMMIHDAASFSFGNSDEHAKESDVLDKLSAQYASVYARKSGMAPDQVRALMKNETWLSAEEAVALGLADGIIDDAEDEDDEPEAVPVAAFPYRLYAHAPDRVLAHNRDRPDAGARRPLLQSPVLSSPPVIEDTMPTASLNLVDPTGATAKIWAADFYALAEAKTLTIGEAVAIVNGAETIEAAKDRMIDLLADRHAARQPDPNGSRHIQFGRDGRDKWMEGVTRAFLSYDGIEKPDPTSEFHGMKPMDLVRDCLARANIRVASRDPMRMVAAVMTNTSSDFTNVVANIANKAMLTGYEETGETFELWTGTGSLPDFKTARRVDLNLLPSLPVIPELGEYNYLYTGDRGEAYYLYTAGGMITISRQAVINDDLDLFGKLPRRLGRAAKRTIGNDVYGILNNNPLMSDNNALFSASHLNYFSGATTALQTSSLQTAWQAMITQKDRSQTKVVLGLEPKFMIVPAALKLSALQLLRSTAAIGQANPGVINTVQNIVDQIVCEPRLDAVSTTAWYLAADPFRTDTVEVIYLNGVKEPVLEEFNVQEIDGVGFKVRIDYGVKAFGWEGMNKSAGA